MLQLVDPFVGAKDSYRSLLAEFASRGEEPVPYTLGYPHENFPALVARLLAEREGIGLPEGWARNSTFWLMEGDAVVGVSNLRHRLTPDLSVVGGHIGYGIRPSARGRGHAKVLLRLTLMEASTLDIDRALLTCAKDNLASAAVIVANGGVLKDEAFVDSVARVVQRYWVPTRG